MAVYVDKKTGHVLSMNPQPTLRMDQVESNARMLVMAYPIENGLQNLKEKYDNQPREQDPHKCTLCSL